ncbi:MAG: DUF4931 domain-containing protein [Clostridiales bacterium]|jgi:UDPglucose--hexose-1-phosphate uridylyltransferase|nr:DUF4931 domain-containing protein [Clostridiales bacterium]
MPEVRIDYLTEDIVTIAEERANRPHFFKHETHSGKQFTEYTEGCPFCPENSHMLPDPIYVSQNGRVIVVPNKYPAFSENGSGYGFHEVIIDTPRHTQKFNEFSEQEISGVLSAIQSRLNYYRTLKRIKYVQIIKNDGRSAGASIYHSHWQIFAMDFVPNKQRLIHTNLHNYRRELNSCFLCDIQKNEGTLKIYENAGFFAYSPYASLYPNMVQILPKEHISDFADFDGKAINSLSEILKKAVNALNILMDDVSFNICFQNAPYDSPDEKYKCGHFFIQLIPRISNFAGFELSTGCFINMVKPEKSCLKMKEIINGYSKMMPKLEDEL